jgi:glycosyltransferase involved in cell wall biosynthesis
MISICIPTYEAGGSGVHFLKKNIESILKQTYKNLEIIVSDHSKDNEIENYIKNLKNDKILYLKNNKNIGYPAFNTNNAIENAKGDYIKLMNMDDYMESDTLLNDMLKGIELGYKWVLTSFNHFNYDTNNFYNPILPRIDGDGKHLLMGVNTIGCPSVVLMPKNIFFDTEVKYMIDCELWYRLFDKFGLPFIIGNYGLTIGTGNHTLTNQLNSKYEEMLQKDINYCSKKYKL